MKTIKFAFTDQKGRTWHMVNSFPDTAKAKVMGIDIDPDWGIRVITPHGSDYCMYRTRGERPEDIRLVASPLAKKICSRIWNEYQKSLND